MANEVRPYLVPASRAVQAAPWRANLDGEWVELEDRLDGWDPEAGLEITRSLKLDHDALTSTAGLPRNTRVVVTVSWMSSSTGMRERIYRSAVTQSECLLMSATLDGKRVAGRLMIMTTVTLGENLDGVARGVASRAGSVLFRDDKNLELDSGARAFPIAMVDFSNTRFDPEASWRLQSASDLEAPFWGTFLVLINSRDKELVGAIESGGKDGRSRLLLDDLEAGVAALMFEIALQQKSALHAGQEWPTGSVGEVLSGYLPELQSRNISPALADAEGLPDFRARIDGLVRAVGHGRRFA